MTPSTRKLSTCIEIQRQFLRSANLEKDYLANNQNGEYIITPTSRQVLRRVTEGLSEDSTYRAWTITGPYGVGKSAFAVFLTKLLCSEVVGSKRARKHLEDADKSLANDLIRRIGNTRGMLPVVITARRAPAALCLAEGIQASLEQIQVNNKRKPLVSECTALVRDVRNGEVTDSRRIVSLVDALATAAKGSGFSGLLFMVDELGKLFEFAARWPQKADVFVLQELAEQASRSGEFPSLFLGFLHQSFEQYGQHLDSLTRKEWAKIHGRFEDVAFLEPTDQVVRMVAAAIKWTGADLPANVTKEIKRVAHQCAESGVCPPGMRNGEFEEICRQTYPLHPVALVALPFIFRRFGQNERSLFSYLGSLEPNGFQDFLRTHTAQQDSPCFLRLSQVFDYFTVNFGAGLFRQPQARRWLEAADVLDRKENLTSEHGDLIKAIGVLGALGEFSHLSATETMLGISLSDTAKMPSKLRENLRFLLEQSILTHRRFNNTYKIWEGSDVDINERVAEGERQLRGRIDLAANIQQYLPPRPIVARRHNFQTGSLRYFSVRYLDNPDDVPANLSPVSGAAGQVLVCLSSSPAQLQDFRKLAESIRSERKDVVFAIPQQIGEIQSSVAELTVLRWASDNTPELRDDRVARREMSLRITEAEYFLRHSLETLLDPREEPLGSGCLWYWNGELQDIHSRVDVSQMLSVICDKLYPKTPWIRNELIARKALSSAAAAARRNLIERMLTAADLPVLGIESFPPERSMYESVLKATSLHRQDDQGAWGFHDPLERKHHGVGGAWARLREIIFDSGGEPTPVDMVFRMLAEPPYGVMEGLHPVFLSAFMLAHPDETTLYREGTFLPEPAIADFEVLMRRPELFGVGGSRILGARAAVVDRLAKGLKTKPATVPIVRTLFKMVKHLPDLAWKTKRLDENTISLREAFDKAKSPERFLFVELPGALGFNPFPEHNAKKADIDAFFDALNSALQEWTAIASATYSNAKSTLLKACRLDATDTGWQQLREICARLEPRESDPVLVQFVRRVVQASCDEAGIASVLGLVANRPPANWLDTDVERFPMLAEAMGESIHNAMVRAGMAGEPDLALQALKPQQREKAKSLSQKFKRTLERSIQGAAPEIVRAALLLLAERLDKGIVDKK